MPEKKAETPASKASTTQVKTATGIDIICLDPRRRIFPMHGILFAISGLTSKFKGVGMKKGEKIEAFVESLGTGSTHDPCYEGYFICFNEQKYYEAHDVLEHLWLKEKGPAHQFFKGLIQLAGAFVHLQKQYRRPEHPTDGQRLRPAWRLFKLAQTNLEPFFPVSWISTCARVLELCSKNMLAIERAEFKSNPWSPVAAPTLALRSRGKIRRWMTSRLPWQGTEIECARVWDKHAERC